MSSLRSIRGIMELIQANFYGPPGHGRTSIIRELVKEYGKDAFALPNDTTREVSLRVMEQIGQYRYAPWKLVERRAKEGHYRYPPKPVFDGGKMNLSAIPKWEYYPIIPSGVPLVYSSAPLDPDFPPPPDWPRRVINFFVLTDDIKVVEDRLRVRCGKDLGSFEEKMRINRDFYRGVLGTPPNLYLIKQYDHILYNDFTLRGTMAQLAIHLPGLWDRMIDNQ